MRSRGVPLRCAWAVALVFLGCQEAQPDEPQPPVDAVSGDAGHHPGTRGPDAGKTSADAGGLTDAGRAPGDGLVEPPLRPAAAGLSPLPRPERADTRLVVRVLAQDLAPAAGVAVHARGAAATTDNLGIATIEDVFAEGTADVFAVGDVLVGGHTRVPLVAGQRTHHALVFMGSSERAPLDNLAEALAYEQRDPATNALTLSVALPAASLQTLWQEAPTGRGELRYRTFGPETLKSAPGDLRARVNGTVVDLRASGLFELVVAQGGSPMRLVQAAAVSARALVRIRNDGQTSTEIDAGVAEPVGGEARKPQTLYRFDPYEGLFVPAGEATYLPADGGAGPLVTARIERFGLYLVGEVIAKAGSTMESGGCHRLTLTDGTGTALSGVVVRSVGTGRVTTRWTDAAGSTCLSGEAGELQQVQYFGPAGMGSYATGETTITLGPAGGGTCATACGQTTEIVAEALTITCVTGTSEGPRSPMRLLATVGEDILASEELPRGQSFCLNVPAETSLELVGRSGDTCDAPVVASTAPGLCGMDVCQDVGVLRCCSEIDECATGYDEDCDGQVDEGCFCGETACQQLRRGQPCCMEADACGLVSPIDESTCVARAHVGSSDATCPSEMHMVQGDPTQAEGCCEVSGTCGVTHGSYGCIPRQLAHHYLELASGPLSAVTCTP